MGSRIRTTHMVTLFSAVTIIDDEHDDDHFVPLVNLMMMVLLIVVQSCQKETPKKQSSILIPGPYTKYKTLYYQLACLTRP